MSEQLTRSAQTGTGKLHSVQVLRFLAALAVVLFHCIGTAAKYFQQTEWTGLSIFRHGDKGVDLFFVISGFIIYQSVQTNRRPPAQFMAQRLERVVPLYWLATLVFIGLQIAVPSAFRSEKETLDHILRSFFFLSFSSGREPVVYPGWSLEYEMFFYVCTAVLMSWPSRTWSLLFKLFLSLVTFGLILRLFHTSLGMPSLFFSSLLLEFLTGVLVARALAGREPVLHYALLIAAVAAGCACISGDTRALYAGIPAGVIVYLAARYSPTEAKNPLFKLASVLGDASYSTYLTHIFVVSAICKVFSTSFPSASINLVITVTASVSLLTGYLVYIGVERPLLRVGHRLLDAVWAERRSSRPASRPTA